MMDEYQIEALFNELRRHHDECCRELQKLNKTAEESLAVQKALAEDVHEIRTMLEKTQPGKATKLELQFDGGLPGMPATETDTQTIPCTALETDAAGQPVTLNPANVTWSIDDPSIASLTQNPDGSATFKALKIGTANVKCTDNVANISGTDTLTVTAGVAIALALSFGAAA